MYDSVLAGLPRSNNLFEGWQTLVGCSNPTLWTLLTALKKTENLTLSKRVKMSLGKGPEPKGRKWRMYDQRLSNIVNDFDDYVMMIIMLYYYVFNYVTYICLNFIGKSEARLKN
jgi:hypothetical protein